MNRKNGYRDMEKYKNTRNRQKRRYYAKSMVNNWNKNKEYTKEEIELILKHEITDNELSELIGRSVRAIQHKRCKLKQEMLLQNK